MSFPQAGLWSSLPNPAPRTHLGLLCPEGGSRCHGSTGRWEKDASFVMFCCPEGPSSSFLWALTCPSRRHLSRLISCIPHIDVWSPLCLGSAFQKFHRFSLESVGAFMLIANQVLGRFHGMKVLAPPGGTCQACLQCRWGWGLELA